MFRNILRLIAIVVMAMVPQAAAAAPISADSTGQQYSDANMTEREAFVRLSVGVKSGDQDAINRLVFCLVGITGFAAPKDKLSDNLAAPLSQLLPQCEVKIKAEDESERQDKYAATALFAKKATGKDFAALSEGARDEYGSLAASRLGPALSEDRQSDLGSHLVECLTSATASTQARRRPLTRLTSDCAGSYKSTITLGDASLGSDFLNSTRERQVQYIARAVDALDSGKSEIERAASIVFVDRCLKTALNDRSRGAQSSVAMMRKSELFGLVRVCLVMRVLGR